MKNSSFLIYDSIKNHRAIFYAAWFGINLAQAAFTSLQEDEAYYWMYSNFLDWGYFDHPPFIALLIKAGTTIFPGELGVRFFCVVLNTLTILLVEKLLPHKNAFLFYAICLSVAVLQIAGFWAVPDIPLIFFTALFLWVYKRFLNQNTWNNTLLLAVTAALLLYSKYHGVFVLFFTLIANLKLLRNYKVYVCGVLALLLFLPHLWWQYQHDWITFRFQLFEKNAEPYHIGITLKYIVSQALVTGPFAGVIILASTIAYRPKTVFEKTLKFNAVGILLFFLLNSFRGNIEANWTAPAVIPMMVLTHTYLQDKQRWRKALVTILPLTLLLVVLIRFVMVVDVLPTPAVKERFHSWNNWPQELRQKTGNLPVVFPSSYQQASLYQFYGGGVVHSLNSYSWRRNNFDYWPIEDSILGKQVCFINNRDKAFTDSVQTPNGIFGFTLEPSFTAFTKIKIETDSSAYFAQEARPVSIIIKADIPPNYLSFLKQHPTVDPKIKLAFFSGINLVGEAATTITLRDLIKNGKQQLSITPPGGYSKLSFEFAIQAFGNFYTHNSLKKKLIFSSVSGE